jgi:hypothetical protein
VKIAEAFVVALERAGRADSGRPELLPSRLTRACADVLPVSGVGMALFAGSIRVPLGASDEAAADAERLQFTTGEGPCIQAHLTSSTVQVDEAEIADRWPLFHAELRAKTRVRSIVAVPLAAPLSGLGTVDFFYDDPHDAFRADLWDVTAVVDRMATLLIDGVPLPTLAAPDLTPPGWLSRPMTGRSDVIVAVGMLNAALDLTSQQALDVLRGHAWASDRTLDDTAHDIVTRHLSTNDLAVTRDD